ncbi:amylo-alpha-1,6-glucosidase [Phytoactinopolyspora endophytica]|uniref:amylo-alpha-1,6-glucosidase n=1 Tax=Phytoactinopolyspora endophytica TaxID=1642495 RepID=UPI00101DF119|nr:trehalase family glycosidase [Phytoactinopolyspora endophytica]
MSEVPRPVGWNTWDVRYHTGVAHLPTGLRLRFGLAAPRGDAVHDGFTWRHGLVRLGHHTVDGAYAQVTVAALETTLDLQFAGGGDTLDAVASATADGPTGQQVRQLSDQASVRSGSPADVVVIVDRMPGFDVEVRFDVEASRTGHANVAGSAPTTGAVDGILPPAMTVLVDGRPWRLMLNAPIQSTTTGDDGALHVTVAGADATELAVRLDPVRTEAGRSDPATDAAVADQVNGAGAELVNVTAPEPVSAARTELVNVTASERVSSARTTALAERLHTSGWLGDAGDAYVRAVAWNTVYAPDLDRVLTPTSRDFVCAEREGFYGTWALHTWDTFFTGLVASWVDPSYARGIFGQILDQADERGMLPNRVSDDRGRTDDRSQPPVGALTVLKAYLGSGLSDQTRDRTILSSGYDALRRWHEWWPTARRGPHGLLAWGSDPAVRVSNDQASATDGDEHVHDEPGTALLLDQARRESGLDDSPMYDDVTYDASTHTMDLADVGLNALHIADAEALAVVAGRLDDDATATKLREEAEAARSEFNRLLWDAEHGEYRNRSADGEFSERVSPTMLYPLLAGGPTEEQAASLVGRLLDLAVLGGEPPLPSAARNDPSFSTRYWRGRVWAPMVYLAVEGLRRYGFDDEVRQIVRSLLDIFLDEWNRHSHVRENYPVRPGEDVRPLAARSDGLMSWGSLLAYLAFQELADPRVDGWRFAHPGADAELAGIPTGDGRLTVRAAETLTVLLGPSAPTSLDAEATASPRPEPKPPVTGQATGSATVLLEADPHVVVSAYRRGRDVVSGVATAHGSAGRISVAPPPGAHGRVEVHVDDASAVHTFGSGQQIEVDVPAPGVSVLFQMTREKHHSE